MCIVYRDSETVGSALSGQSNQFFQLYVYIVSIVRFVGSDTIFAVYSDDEGSRETIGARYDMEEGVYGFRLGVFPDRVSDKVATRLRHCFTNCIIQLMK